MNKENKQEHDFIIKKELSEHKDVNPLCALCIELTYNQGITWCSFDDPYAEKSRSTEMVYEDFKECPGFTERQ